MIRYSTTAFLFTFSIAMLAIPYQWCGADDLMITINKTVRDSGANPPFSGQRPAVDVAILLDTSSSMNGLIDQAKSQLWNIVQQFGEAKKAGKTPVLRVSVFEYGNSGLPASEGYIRQVVQLTDDLDKVSEVMFALKTGGGDEYCGQVIEEAIKRLDWSSEPNGYKAIFIAGNEPFTQGPTDYKSSCKTAIENGIVVNTIHCGDYQTGINSHWKDGADRAEGAYMNINQDHKVVHVDCPQDKIIIKLNSDLNQTYLWFGNAELRASYSENQIAQDRNALSVGGQGGFGSGRGLTKASSLYRNTGRDLVDTYAEDNQILAKLKKEQLPTEMQSMSSAEQRAHVEKMAKQRTAIQQQIGQLSREREAYAANKRKELSENESVNTLGDAVTAAVRAQLQASGFELVQ